MLLSYAHTCRHNIMHALLRGAEIDGLAIVDLWVWYCCRPDVIQRKECMFHQRGKENCVCKTILWAIEGDIQQVFSVGSLLDLCCIAHCLFLLSMCISTIWSQVCVWFMNAYLCWLSPSFCCCPARAELWSFSAYYNLNSSMEGPNLSIASVWGPLQSPATVMMTYFQRVLLRMLRPVSVLHVIGVLSWFLEHGSSFVPL